LRLRFSSGRYTSAHRHRHGGKCRLRRLLEKARFRLEGELRESYYLAGRWQNDWLFGLLRHEYLNNNPDQQPFGGYFHVVSSTVSPLRGNEYERSCAENIFCRHCVNKKHQGLSLEKYRDENGLWVIGYGHVIRDQDIFTALHTSGG
jgi:hypothetical protein